jgi:hypothetical protein
LEEVMASSGEVFQHAYQDALQALDRNRLANESELHAAEARDRSMAPPDTEAPKRRAQRVLHDIYNAKIRGVLSTVSSGRQDSCNDETDRSEPERPDPEIIVGRTLRALHQIEDFRSLLANLLEAVKRGDSLLNSLAAYQAIGLVETKNFDDDLKDIQQSPWHSSLGAGRFLRKMLRKLAEAALIVMRLVLAAIQSAARFVSLKPKPSIGLAGPFPMLNLQFDLDVESVTIHDLFEDLINAVRAVA